MALTAFPFDNQDTTETQYSRLFRELQDSGIADSSGGPGFAVTAAAGGVRVQPGFAILRGHAVWSTDVETLTVAAPDAGTRTDRIVLRLDPAADSIVLTVLPGAAGGEPPAPTQTDTGVFELAVARCTADTGGGFTIVDDRQFVGSRVGAWSTDTRPVNPRTAQLGFNTSGLSWEYWTGSQWTALAGTVSWSDVTGKPATFTPTGHVHGGADITTGTISVERLPVGPSVTQVAAGNHAHAWAVITGKPGTFPPAAHTHGQYLEAGDTIARANGSDRVHTHTPAGSGWYSVWVDGNHNFCKNTSSIRYKRNVRDAAIDLRAVLALRPVVYDRRDTVTDGVIQPGRRDEFGLIAEEVARLLPDLVIHDEHGRPDALRYDLLAVALIPLLRAQHERIAALEARLGDPAGGDRR